jgi:UrcA family protein
MNMHTDRLFRIGAGIAHSAAALITLLALVPVTVGAEDLPWERVLESHSVKVSLSDLDLTTDRGIQIASERIHKTEWRLCSRLQDTRDITAVVRCIDRAIAGASAELSALSRRAAEPTLASVPESSTQGR